MTPDSAKPWTVRYNRAKGLVSIARNGAFGLPIDVEQAVSLMEQLKEAIDRVHAHDEGHWEDVEWS